MLESPWHAQVKLDGKGQARQFTYTLVSLNHCWADIQIFGLLDIAYVISCSLISEVYVRYKEVDI